MAIGTMMISTVGSINERGYLKGFKRRGYTEAKCLLELVANSLDSIDRKGSSSSSGSSSIRFDIGITEIRMSDRGSEGMDRTALAAMFDLHRENHASDASRGVSGIGAKPALTILSGDRDMFLLTHKEGGEYLKVDIPWGDIHRDGIYTGKVHMSPMTPADAAAFGTTPGTTIVFPYSDVLRTLIHDNFTSIDSEEGNTLTAPLDRIGIVFGREAVPIEYVTHEKLGLSLLPKYNYFDGTDAEFYKGVKRAIIEHWYAEEGGKDRFICEDMEIIRFGRGWSKEPSKKTTGTHGFRRVGDYEVLVGLRRNTAIFDDAAPVLPTADKKHQNAYNTEHLGANNREYLAHSKLVRNGQTIGLIPLADMNIANARANGETHVKVDLVQCEVRFNPVSTQDNRQDTALGIQENKNQFDGESLPMNFKRLVKDIRMKKAEEIWTYFEERVVAFAPAPAPAPAPSPAPSPAESEPESESESESEPILPPALPSTPSFAPADPLTIEAFPDGGLPTSSLPPANGTEICDRLAALMCKINAAIVYPPELLAALATLELHLQ